MGEDWGNHVDLSVSSVGTGRNAEHVYLLIIHLSQLLYELGSSWMFHGLGSCFLCLVDLSKYCV